MADEKEVTTHLFSKQEVAEILAHYIGRTSGDYIVNPRLDVGTYDIVLVSDRVE